MAPPLTEDNAFGRLRRDPSSPSGWRDGPTGAFPSKDLIDLVERRARAFGAIGEIRGSRSAKIDQFSLSMQTKFSLTPDEAEQRIEAFFRQQATEGIDPEQARRETLYENLTPVRATR